MKIIFYDGGVLEGHKVWFGARELIVDDIYTVPLVNVAYIEEEDDND